MSAVPPSSFRAPKRRENLALRTEARKFTGSARYARVEGPCCPLGPSAEKEKAEMIRPPLWFALLLLLNRLGHNFLSIIPAAVFANSVSHLELMAMRALYKRCRRCLIVCKALIRPAFGLFSLRNSHLTPLNVVYSDSSSVQFLHRSREGSANRTLSRRNSPKSMKPFA